MAKTYTESIQTPAENPNGADNLGATYEIPTENSNRPSDSNHPNYPTVTYEIPIEQPTPPPGAGSNPFGGGGVPADDVLEINEEDWFDGRPKPDVAQKAKGAAQMAAGAAVAAVGVPMLILPGPGALAIAGGVSLATKGQRNFSGREASAFEEKLDAATDAMAAVAKDKAEAAAQKVAEEAPVIAGKAVQTASAVANDVAEGFANVASEVSPVIMSKLDENAPEVADGVRKAGAIAEDIATKAATAGGEAYEKAREKAPEVARMASEGFGAAIAFGKSALDQISKNRR